MLGRPQTLKNLERKSWKTVFLGSQPFVFGKSPSNGARVNSLALRHAGKLAVRIGFDEGLAHKIEAGTDMFLMPSRYEPCGLNQLYSLKYGTIPIVRATGGLKDSVEEFDPVSGTGTGFVFESYSGAALQDAMNRALATYYRKDEWGILMKNAMTVDHSWSYSAREYLALYHKLLG